MYTVYKTTCLNNEKFYIGVHKTNNPMDSYLGSGKLVKRSIKKYGINRFHKEVLYIFETAIDAYSKERELVTTDLVESHQCFNLKLGARGGFEFINENGLSVGGNPRSTGWKTCYKNKIGLFDRSRDCSKDDRFKKVSDLDLLSAYVLHKSLRKALRAVGLAETGGGVRRIKRILQKNTCVG